MADAVQSDSELVVTLTIRPDPDPGLDEITYPDGVTEHIQVAAGGVRLAVLREAYQPQLSGGAITLTLVPVTSSGELEISGTVRVRNIDGSPLESAEVHLREPIRRMK
jgi:hypothetical protein